ncbi:EAL domain-containing protein [Vibrio rotiferianus]|uniref:EAL domain-containing protein n=1 Tax=Vibrio rotiferianus TaxID=190895 RepID=UPI00406A73BD
MKVFFTKSWPERIKNALVVYIMFVGIVAPVVLSNSFLLVKRDLIELMEEKSNRIDKIIQHAEVASMRAAPYWKYECKESEVYITDLAATTPFISGIYVKNRYGNVCQSYGASSLRNGGEVKNRLTLSKGNLLNPNDYLMIYGDRNKFGDVYSSVGSYYFLSLLDSGFKYGQTYLRAGGKLIDRNGHIVELGTKETLELKSDKYDYSLIVTFGWKDVCLATYDNQLMLFALFILGPVLTIVFTNRVRDQKKIVEREIRESLSKGHFVPYIQPIVDGSGNPTHAEVLARWDHPAHGLIPPSVFIEVAEETGMIIPMTSHLMASVSQYIVDNKHVFNVSMSISFNISSKHLESFIIIEDCRKFIDKCGDKVSLCLELTERELIEPTPLVKAIFREVKEMGVTVALDDFGTGYATLDYLRVFDVDTLKIDKAFVDHVGSSFTSTKIVNTLIELSKHLGLKTVVEGVETREQAEYFIMRSVDLMQGYYYSKPLDLNGFSEYIAENRKNQKAA